MAADSFAADVLEQQRLEQTAARRQAQHVGRTSAPSASNEGSPRSGYR